MPRLLDVQRALVEHLTGPDAIFGGDAATRDPLLAGFDPARLRLEASFSFAKRKAKIEVVFPRACALLGARLDGLWRDFAYEVPPTGLGRLDNARQFHEFLGRGRCDAPPHLADVAALEMAMAEARTYCHENDNDACGAPGTVRRAPGVFLVRCHHDVRALFDDDRETAAPAIRDVPLAVHRPAEAREPAVFEIPDWLFAALDALDGWTAWDAIPLAQRADAALLHTDLCARGLLQAGP